MISILVSTYWPFVATKPSVGLPEVIIPETTSESCPLFIKHRPASLEVDALAVRLRKPPLKVAWLG